MVFIHKLLKPEYMDVNFKWENSIIERAIGHLSMNSEVISKSKLLSWKERANDTWVEGSFMKFKMKQLFEGRFEIFFGKYSFECVLHGNLFYSTSPKLSLVSYTYMNYFPTD